MSRLAVTDEPAPIRLPANYERVYLTKLTGLEDHLASDHTPAAREAIRKLIDKVVVLPDDARGSNRWRSKTRPLELHGDLFKILNFAAAVASGPTRLKTTASPATKVAGDAGYRWLRGQDLNL